MNETLKWYRELKKEVCCKRCGIMHSAVIEFHHLDPNEKKENISRMVKFGCSISDVKEELTKCEPVCKNCHSIIHYNADHGYTDNRWPYTEGYKNVC